MVQVLVGTLIAMTALLAGCAWQRGRARREHVPPGYRVLVSDLGGRRGMLLRDNEWGVIGRPDLVLEHRAGGEVVLIEYKHAWRGYEPGTTRRSHALQLGAYFLLCEGDARIGRRPEYGLVRYVDESGHVVPGGEVRIRNTADLRQDVILTVQALRRAILTRAEQHRTHNTEYNCRHCADRRGCQEAKV